MTEVLGETWIRDRNEITISIPIRSYCRLGPGDGIRWIKMDNGDVVVKKIVSKIVNNNCGDGNGSSQTD